MVKFLKVPIILILLLLLTSLFLRFTSPDIPPPGEMYDVGGFQMHIDCMGQADNLPTVIIEAGLGGATPMYRQLQNQLSQSVRVCSYDRAGLGWSEESRQPHDAEHMSRQLHTLLQKANVPGPYILAGHSLAGLIMRVYASKYPQDVAGIAFLDASHPEHNRRLLDEAGFDIEKAGTTLYKRLKWAATLGLTHIYNPLLESADDDLPVSVRAQAEYILNQPKNYNAALQERASLGASARQAAATGSLGNIPVTTITASIVVPPSGTNAEKFKRAWQEPQKKLLTLSPDNRFRMIDGADHISLVNNQKFVSQVVDEIHKLVQRAL